MGRSRLIHYTVQLHVAGNYIITPCEWRIRSRDQRPADGKPTAENLAKYVRAFEQSCRDGANKHLGPMVVLSAWLKHHGEIIATYKG